MTSVKLFTPSKIIEIDEDKKPMVSLKKNQKNICNDTDHAGFDNDAVAVNDLFRKVFLVVCTDVFFLHENPPPIDYIIALSGKV